MPRFSFGIRWCTARRGRTRYNRRPCTSPTGLCMRVTIFGTGYVGLVTGACLAEMGNHVLCVDVDAAKVARLERGEIPIFEPGLEPLVRRNHATGRLTFTTDGAAGVAHGQVIFIAVGTPPDEDGSADLQYVVAVARSIGTHLDRPAVIVNKSTVPVGTADRVRAEIAAALKARKAAVEFDVVSNPEFLKEGDAVNDCMKPDRIIIGATSPSAWVRTWRWCGTASVPIRASVTPSSIPERDTAARVSPRTCRRWNAPRAPTATRRACWARWKRSTASRSASCSSRFRGTSAGSCGTGPSRCGVSPSNPIPTTCARHPAGC